MTGDSEQDEEVFRPAAEQNKEVRTTQSGASTPREGDEFKGSVSSLLSDEWQPRRSERIFINSSVTTNSSSSPLSPTGKGSEFSYTKKTKRMSLTKGVSISNLLSLGQFSIECLKTITKVITPANHKGHIIQ